MSFFPILDGKELPELMDTFAADPRAAAILPEEDALFFQELAARLARSGKEGVAFLLRSLPDADCRRRQAILGAFAFADVQSIGDLLESVKSSLLAHFASADPAAAANAVDSANALGIVDLASMVRSLLEHKSPLVVGSALRYVRAHFPADARKLLVKALRSPEPIIRQNAIDELDELECKEALPCIAGLLNDPDKNVRDAAQWAVRHLQTV